MLGWALLTFVKGMKIRLCRNSPSNVVRGESIGAYKTEVKTGLRANKNIEIISGLNEGDIIVAEGLKKVRPSGKIKPINK